MRIDSQNLLTAAWCIKPNAFSRRSCCFKLVMVTVLSIDGHLCPSNAEQVCVGHDAERAADLDNTFAIACTCVEHRLPLLTVVVAPILLILLTDHVCSVQYKQARFAVTPLCNLRMTGGEGYSAFHMSQLMPNIPRPYVCASCFITLGLHLASLTSKTTSTSLSWDLSCLSALAM